MIDVVTKRWIRSVADEKAAADGFRFDEGRAEFVVNWLQEYLLLYEGEYAGQPFTCRDWQHDCTMRMFGWVRFSERWGREVRRFRKASLWVPKKNKKSPTLAAWGLYLLCGDGEPGQKVFLCAKDGQQARDISGKHCIEMVQVSERLMAECTINLTKMSITHEPSRSVLIPLSSANEEIFKAKEGINGSVLVDEVHVVDDRFMRRVKRAGISRSEPLHIEVSTAGNDPESYGKARYDYGKRIESGEESDPHTLFISYEAPHDLTDEQLDADPVKYGKLANPAWGHTVGEEEYLADYHESKRSIQEFADFKMYRLNIWQKSANPWLRFGDWLKCYRPFALDDFAEQPCVAGLDLSKTQDMSSLVLIFGDEGDDTRFYQVPFFWIPEETARKNAHLAPLLDWHHKGHIDFCSGGTIDQRDIFAKLKSMSERFRILAVLYDKKYAEELTKQAQEELDIERIEFSQTVMAFAGPTADYEAAVIDGRLHHNGNEVLTWQAGHVQVRSDVNNNKRPVKPPHNDHRKIDGIVAGIMAFSQRGLIAEGRVRSYYEDHAIEFV